MRRWAREEVERSYPHQPCDRKNAGNPRKQRGKQTDRGGWKGPPNVAERGNKRRSGTEGKHEAFGKGKQQGPHTRAAGASCSQDPNKQQQPHCKEVQHKTARQTQGVTRSSPLARTSYLPSPNAIAHLQDPAGKGGERAAEPRAQAQREGLVFLQRAGGWQEGERRKVGVRGRRQV